MCIILTFATRAKWSLWICGIHGAPPVVRRLRATSLLRAPSLPSAEGEPVFLFLCPSKRHWRAAVLALKKDLLY